MRDSLRQALLIFLILSFSTFLFLKDLKLISATYDEDFSYVRNSIYLVRNLKWDKDYITLHPPLMYYLHGWPFLLIESKDPAQTLYLSRIAILPIFIIFGIALFLVTKKLTSENAAFLVLVLYAFNIEILAHARLITADFIQAVTVFAAIISFYYFLKLPNPKRLFITGLFLGFAFVSKYSGLLLIPIYLTIFLIVKPKHIFDLKIVLKIFSIFAIALLIIHISYFFKETGSIPTTYQNNFFIRIYQNPVIQPLLFIFPKSYLIGMDHQIAVSKSIWWGYFAGKTYYTGLWYFYFVAFLFKTQIPLLILVTLSAVRLFKNRKFDSLDFILLSTIVFFFIYFSFFSKLIIGLRYLLMVYPLLFIFVVKSIRIDLNPSNKNYLKSVVLVTLIVIYVYQVFKISPHYLSYANELIGGPKNSYKYFADSNLDWNQNTIFFERYLKSHPEILAVNPKKPTSGKIAISVNEYNLYYYYDYLWLRNLKKEPVDNVGYTWLIFDIKPSEIN